MNRVVNRAEATDAEQPLHHVAIDLRPAGTRVGHHLAGLQAAAHPGVVLVSAVLARDRRDHRALF